MVLLRTSARLPTHENNHRKVRNPGREGSGPAVKEIDFIKIDVEGHELQGGPGKREDRCVGRSPQANIQGRINIRAARI
jgi:hypothetical protein